jgi:hypothetical protein
MECSSGGVHPGFIYQEGMMKKWLIFILAIMLTIAGCEYQEPLSEKQNLPIDESLVGQWNAVPDSGDTSPVNDRIVVLKLSGTEYLVHYYTGSGSMYFRAYPLKVGNIECLQLHLLGYQDGRLARDDAPFQVAKYTLLGDTVEIRMMNTSIVGSRNSGSAELRDAFIKNQANDKLFRDPGKFRRAKKS